MSESFEVDTSASSEESDVARIKFEPMKHTTRSTAKGTIGRELKVKAKQPARIIISDEDEDEVKDSKHGRIPATKDATSPMKRKSVSQVIELSDSDSEIQVPTRRRRVIKRASSSSEEECMMDGIDDESKGAMALFSHMLLKYLQK